MSAQHTPEKLALKIAAAETIKGVGGFEVSAMHCRVSKSILAEQVDPRCEKFPAIDVIADLEPLARDRAGWPHVTRLQARQLGFELVEVPKTTATGADLQRLFMDQVQEFGQLSGALQLALADGNCCERDADRVLPELNDLIALAVRMRAELQLIKSEGGAR